MGECCERTIDNSPRDRSNGLGQRIVESDGTTNTSLIYDERWRLISRSEAGKYTEETLYHHAGLDGMGGASDIDGVILRRTFLATGTPQTEDKRWYVLQNWRQDAAVIISDAGVQRERAFYSPYGRVFGMPAGDLNFDGEFTSAEATTISGWSAAYRAYADINLDGVIDGDDATANTPGTLGWNALSRDGSTIGYAGYVQDSSIPTLSHVRHRVYKSDLGRWVQRDPAGYVDGANLYEYARSSPVTYVDWSGLASQRGGCGLGGVGVDLCGGIGSRGIIGSFIPVPRIPIPGITVPWVFKCSRDWNKCWEKCKDGSLGKSWCEDGEWQCCICDPYIKQQYSSATEYIAECVDAHETCHTLQECPPEGGYTQKQAACLEVPCYDVEIKCLEVREKLCETESCRKSIKEALEDAKRLRADYQAKCLGL